MSFRCIGPFETSIIIIAVKKYRYSNLKMSGSNIHGMSTATVATWWITSLALDLPMTKARRVSKMKKEALTRMISFSSKAPMIESPVKYCIVLPVRLRVKLSEPWIALMALNAIYPWTVFERVQMGRSTERSKKSSVQRDSSSPSQNENSNGDIFFLRLLYITPERENRLILCQRHFQIIYDKLV